MEISGTTNHILMIRPVNFGFNKETAEDNVFQKKPGEDTTADSVQSKALHEFDTLVSILRANGVEVLVIEDTINPPTPDSIFPNNAFSFHLDGTLCLFPLNAKNRRLERKPTVLERIKGNFRVEKTVDLTSYEREGLFLEGTGAMVLDRVNRIIYASRSARTNDIVLKDFASHLGFSKSIIFESYDESGRMIYHTNVMMSVCDEFVLICLDAILDERLRKMVRTSIVETGKEVIEISLSQVNNFVGNMLQVRNTSGEKLLVMSCRAFHSLSDNQRQRLKNFNRILHSDLTTIEDIGGGSARCMMAEIFLKKK